MEHGIAETKSQEKKVKLNERVEVLSKMMRCMRAGYYKCGVHESMRESTRRSTWSDDTEC
jgi:hypothetical protein